MSIIKASHNSIATSPSETVASAVSSEQLDRIYCSKSLKLEKKEELPNARLILTEPRTNLENFLKNSAYPRKVSADEIGTQQQKNITPASSTLMQLPLGLASSKRMISNADMKRRIEGIAADFGIQDVDPDCVDILQYALEVSQPFIPVSHKEHSEYLHVVHIKE